MANHEYQAPGPNDSRSPCPVLNTLANHGYLPRDGKNISASQLIQAIYEGLNVTKVLDFILAHGGVILAGKSQISLEDLYDTKIEHDMSLTRPDKALSEDYKKVSQSLIDSLISEADQDNLLSRKSFARQFIKRRDESLKDNHNFHGLYSIQKTQIFGEYSLTLCSFPGEARSGKGEAIDVDTLVSFYKYERFPENWRRLENTLSLYQVHTVASDIRKIVDELDKENEDKKKNK